MPKVNTDLKFSYNLVKGSVESRRQFVSALNEKIYENMSPLFKNKKCDIVDFAYNYNKQIPESKNINISQISHEYSDYADAMQVYDASEKGEILGQGIEMNVHNGKIKEKSFCTFIHENTHILQNMANPKNIARVLSISHINSRVQNWFVNNLYLEEFAYTAVDKNKVIAETKVNTEKFIKRMPKKDRINILQNIRYTLQGEQQAFNEQRLYAEKQKMKGRPIDSEDLTDANKVYLFPEKEKMIGSLLIEMISKERKNIVGKNS